MIMDDGEIIRDYQAAADKKKQVQVLADLNCVTTSKMAEWLHDHGQEVDKRLLPKRPAPKPFFMKKKVLRVLSPTLPKPQ